MFQPKKVVIYDLDTGNAKKAPSVTEAIRWLVRKRYIPASGEEWARTAITMDKWYIKIGDRYMIVKVDSIPDVLSSMNEKKKEIKKYIDRPRRFLKNLNYDDLEQVEDTTYVF